MIASVKPEYFADASDFNWILSFAQTNSASVELPKFNPAQNKLLRTNEAIECNAVGSN